MSRGKSARGETYEQIRRIDAAAENDNAANNDKRTPNIRISGNPKEEEEPCRKTKLMRKIMKVFESFFEILKINDKTMSVQISNNKFPTTNFQQQSYVSKITLILSYPHRPGSFIFTLKRSK